MNVARWLAEAAQEWPSRPALATGYEVESTYREFARTASSLAGHLHDCYGVRPGDRVVIYLENSTRYLECLFAIWWAGAVAVPVNHKLHGAEVVTIVDDVDPMLLFAASSDRRLLSAAGVEVVCAEVRPDGWALPMDGPLTPVDRAPEDCAWIFYSSGTTGRPKGVMLSNTNLVAMSLCYLADVDEVLEGETALYAAPISHGAGLYSLIHVRRGSQHLVPESGGFDAEEVLDLAKAWGTVSMFAAPTMVRRLVANARRRPDPGRGLKTVVYGGGPMYLADIEEAMEVMGDRFVQIYGQAESPMTVTVLSRDSHRRARAARNRRVLSSVGRPHSGVSVRTVSSDGEELGAGEVGEIEVRGSTVMLGYWGDPEATSRTLRGGWLRTGDLGYLDEAGFLTLAGRSKEVIISGGSNIYPREVEDALISHPDVVEAAVIGVPDREWGEVVAALVVAAPDTTLSDAALDEHCLQLIARFKRPRIYRVVDQLPKNNNGKVVKSQLDFDLDLPSGGPSAPITRP